MNSTVILLYLLLFSVTIVSTIVFMWQSMARTIGDLTKPTQKEQFNIHPEMRDVESGTELLVFSASEDEDEDDGEGDILVVRR